MGRRQSRRLKPSRYLTFPRTPKPVIGACGATRSLTGFPQDASEVSPRPYEVTAPSADLRFKLPLSFLADLIPMFVGQSAFERIQVVTNRQRFIRELR